MFFDATQAPELPKWQPLAPGEYEAIVVDAQTKQSNSSGASYVQVTFDCDDKKGGRSKVFNIYNIWHPSIKAQEVSKAHFAELCRAVDMQHLQNLTDLLGKLVLLKVGQRIDQNGDLQNTVKQVSPLVKSSQPVTQQAMQQPAPQQPVVQQPLQAQPWQQQPQVQPAQSTVGFPQQSQPAMQSFDQQPKELTQQPADVVSPDGIPF